MIATLALFFGYVRHFSGSTTLVILLHMLLNLESVLETLVVLGANLLGDGLRDLFDPRLRQ